MLRPLLSLLLLATGCVTEAPANPAAGPTCLVGTEAVKLQECLDSGKGPDDCQATLTAPLCDSDWDGLGDDLETALAKAYAPVFAFNGGSGAPHNSVGNYETNWPGNVRDFVSRAQVRYYGGPGPAMADGGFVVVNPNPTLDTIADATATVDGGIVRASGLARHEGPNFWLCMKDWQNSSDRLNRLSDVRALPHGVDVAYIAHPANGRFGPSDHIVIFYNLFFHYNEFAFGFNDHEGDWEYVGVFVNRKTGAVDHGWFGRHATVDPVQLVSAAVHGVKDPAADVKNNATVEDEASANQRHGLRFWDFAGRRRHLVAYPSTGGHAMFDYPGNTRVASKVPIIGAPRDTHDGLAEKFVTWLGYYTPTWGATAGTTLRFNFVNLGEPHRLGQGWLRFRGQWGCDVGAGPLAASWSGPFGNARWPRPDHSRAWGNPPAAPVKAKPDGGR